MTRLSIIIPVYNVASYIKRCLESVLFQDHVLLDIELIIVDDCGQDQSMDIVRQIVAGYHGPVLCKVLHHDKNLGLSAARNTGLKAATGDYVLFVDSDDYLLPNSISLSRFLCRRFSRSAQGIRPQSILAKCIPMLMYSWAM